MIAALALPLSVPPECFFVLRAAILAPQAPPLGAPALALLDVRLKQEALA